MRLRVVDQGGKVHGVQKGDEARAVERKEELFRGKFERTFWDEEG